MPDGVDFIDSLALKTLELAEFTIAGNQEAGAATKRAAFWVAKVGLDPFEWSSGVTAVTAIRARASTVLAGRLADIGDGKNGGLWEQRVLAVAAESVNACWARVTAPNKLALEQARLIVAARIFAEPNALQDEHTKPGHAFAAQL